MLIAVSQMDSLIEELERSYADAQERMSDPAIFADHHQAADAGRRLKELEGPHKLAQEWRLDERGPGGRARGFGASGHGP